MIHPKHHHNFAVVILLGVILLFVLLVFSGQNFFQTNKRQSLQNPAGNDSAQERYTSDFLKISILKPDGFTVEEKFGAISLHSNDGEITIGRNGTNYDSLDLYLDDLSERNKVDIIERQKVLIDGRDAIKATIKHSISGNPDNRMYFMYINNFVFSIGTISPELYDELDQIAQSFRYTP